MTPNRQQWWLPLALVAACAGEPPAPPSQDGQPPPPVDTAPAKPAPSRLQRLANGVTAAVTELRTGADTQIQLGILGGSLFVAPGLAELAAVTLIGSAMPNRGQRSLDDEIAAMGGTCTVAVGPASTWVDLRVPGDKLQEALAALRRALDAPTESRTQIDRMRDELVAEHSARIRALPMAAMAQALLRGAAGTGDYVNALLDRDPSEVSLFLTRMYRPERCLLTVAAPFATDTQLHKLADGKDAIGAWSMPAALPGGTEVIAGSFRTGLYWASDDTVTDPCAVAIVMYLPLPIGRNDLDLMVVHGCLTLDGTGGRLERLQAEAGLGDVRWQARVEPGADAFAVVLTARLKAEQVPVMWRVLRRARASLLEIPPNASELELAVRRAGLGGTLGVLDAASRSRVAINRMLRGMPPDILALRLQSLANPTAADLADALKGYVELPFAMVVIGSGRPDASPDLMPFDLLPRNFEPRIAPPGAQPEATAADPWLARADEAVGGVARLRRLVGFAATARQIDEQSSMLSETIQWQFDGELRRTRDLFGQRIETTVTGEQGKETLDGTTKPIGAREATMLRQELQRHPLMLLAAQARGELAFRPIAERTVGDRPTMVLEAVGDRFDRLRMHVDSGSGLVRVVESWVTLPDNTIVHVQETWSDYRSVGALRVPFLRSTSRDDGQSRMETVYDSWRAIERP